jgi:hypothetical protein
VAISLELIAESDKWLYVASATYNLDDDVKLRSL